MALQTVLTSAASAGSIVNLGTADDCVVGAGVNLLSGTSAIVGTGSSQSVTVYGTVYGLSAGIRLNGVGTSAAAVTVAQGASVGGESGAIVVDSANATVLNAGQLNGANWGIYLDGTGSTRSLITNSGVINSASGIGVVSDGRVDILNTGEITSINNALQAATTGEVNFSNQGTIRGGMAFGLADDSLVNTGIVLGNVNMQAGADRVTVRGEISGSIQLGQGNDYYDGGRAGAALEIWVLGGDDDDSFQMGQATETIEGGLGQDLVSYIRAGKAVTVYLDGTTPNGGAAAADLILAVEQAYGSKFNDKLFGTADANVLYGDRGNDTLSGDAGDDTISGVAGNDRLTGGTGNDRFYFYGSPNEGIDTITDFANDLGNDDALYFSAGGLFAGLTPGNLVPGQFRSRTDNLAQDADDRFIFNRTDKTLWFDADGNGAGAAVQVLTIGSATNLTYSDIVII